MKMIVRISATKQKAWRIAEHIYGQGDYKPERNITNRLGPRAFKLNVGYPTGHPKFDAALLLAHHHGRGKEARHLIFSGEELPTATPEQYQHAIAAMVAAAEDFAAKHAPGHAYIIQSHLDRFHPHAHMIMCASNGQRCIDWGPEQLKGFQSLDFLSTTTQNKYQLEPGRGHGKRKPGVGRIAYNHAVTGELHQTKEQQLAERLDYELILAAIDAGTITVSRRTKSGKPLSVVIDGRVIRLSTIRKAAANAAIPNGDSGHAATPTATPRTERRRSRARPKQHARVLVRCR